MPTQTESLYFRDINRYRILSEEEERTVILSIQKNDEHAVSVLITSNLRFVVSVARRYRGRGLSFLELINEGNIGLLKAARRFNLENKVKFISYAVWWIRQSIQKALFEQTGTVRIPPNKIALLAKFKKALDRNSGDYLATITMDDFKEHEQDLIDVMDKLRGVSLDAPVSNTQSAEGDSTKTLLDVLGEEPNQDVESERRELGKVIDSVLQNITSREERILECITASISPSSLHLKKSARNSSLPESEYASFVIAPSGSFSETPPLAQS